jgi:hypothetical protein
MISQVCAPQGGLGELYETCKCTVQASYRVSGVKAVNVMNLRLVDSRAKEPSGMICSDI